MTVLNAIEIAYREELPPEFTESRGRHYCPVPGCTRTARWGNIACGPCWLRVPIAVRQEITVTLRLREQRPDLWQRGMRYALALVLGYSPRECRRRATSSSRPRQPVSDPAPHRRTA